MNPVSFKDLIVYSTEVLRVNALLRLLHKQKIAVLMYHGVVRDNAPFDAWTQVRENEFAKQMAYLNKHYEVIDLHTAEDIFVRQGMNYKPRVIITFDDGYRNNYSVAYPILRHFGFPAVIFLATEYIGCRELFWFDKVISSIQVSGCNSLDLRSMNLKKYNFPSGNRYIRWDAVQDLLTDLKALESVNRDNAVKRIVSTCNDIPNDMPCVLEHLGVLNSEEIFEMAQSGLIEFGSHTHGHEILTQLPVDEVRNSIRTSLGVIKNITGKEVRCFAYPNGNYDEGIIQVLNDENIQYAFSTRSGFWNTESRCMQIPRISIGGYDSKHFFAGALSGLHALKSWLI